MVDLGNNIKVLLTKYSNNVISFTNPKEIYLEINNQNFSSLFRKYIDDIIETTNTEQVRKIFKFYFWIFFV